MRQLVGQNAYVIDLPLNFGISSTFNIKDPIVNKKLHPIPDDLMEIPHNLTLDDPIKTSTPFTLTSIQKDNIDIIPNEQVVFVRGMVNFNDF